MTMPYVAPEQLMKDRADFARQGIARGRSVVALRYRDGICLVAENHSRSLHKISEIHDRLAFAGVGRFNEFESLRIAGIRHADLRGYAYDRSDVTGRALAHAYAQLLGAIFSSQSEKPYEVELIVAELGAEPSGDQMFRLTPDGSVIDESDWLVVGGSAEAIEARVSTAYAADLDLSAALTLAASALGGDSPLSADHLEVGVLDRRTPGRRTFRRLDDVEIAGHLGAQA